MKKYIFIVIICFISVFNVHEIVAKTTYHSKGYHANIMVTNHFFVFMGAETSHGYMFDNHNYLGVGIGGYFLPMASMPIFANTFIDYHNYVKDKKNTLVLGIKLGHSLALNYMSDYGTKYKNAILLEPNIGWNWQFRRGGALYLYCGVSTLFIVGESRTSKKYIPLPKLGVGFEF